MRQIDENRARTIVGAIAVDDSEGRDTSELTRRDSSIQALGGDDSRRAARQVWRPIATGFLIVTVWFATDWTASATELQPPTASAAAIAPQKPDSQGLDEMIRRYSELYKVPLALVRRIIARESRFDPKARNGPYWGLMQIRWDTAKGVGYQGEPTGLLDAENNLAFGMAYLANALVVAHGNETRAEQLYRTGFYYEAKRKRLLARMIQGERRDVMLASLSPAMPQAPDPGKAALDAAAEAAMPTVSLALPLPRPKPRAVAVPVTELASIAAAPPALAASWPLPRPKPVVPHVALLASAAILPPTLDPIRRSDPAGLMAPMEPGFDVEAQALAAMPAPARPSPALAAIGSETAPSSGKSLASTQSLVRPIVETASVADFSPPVPRSRPLPAMKRFKLVLPTLGN